MPAQCAFIHILAFWRSISLAHVISDFRYNLDLLDERDRDLDVLTDLAERLKSQLLARDVEVSDALVRAEAEAERAAMAEAEAEEAKKTMQRRLREMEEEAEWKRREAEAKMDEEREEMLTVKKQLTQR